MSNSKHQGGMFLIEALISILIFSLGILGMIAMGGKAVSAQSDAQYRTEAANLAEEIAGEIALRVNRSGATPAAVTANIAASLVPFKHQITPTGDSCIFSGVEATDLVVKALAEKAGGVPAGNGLPGADTTWQQILVDPAQNNKVTITLCWKTASDSVARRHVLVTYVN